jgi:cytohesin
MKKSCYIFAVVLLLAACGGKQDESLKKSVNEAAIKEVFDAAESGNLNKVKKLINEGIGVNARNEDGETLLHLAARHTNIELAELLINSGAEVDIRDKSGATSLHESAWFGQKSFLQFLISKGADINATDNNGYTPLDYAVDGPRGGETAPLLRKHGGKPGDILRSEIIKAAENGDLARLKALVAKGTDVNVKNTRGYTPLHWAVSQNHKDVVEFLIAEGADVDARSNGDSTPLHFVKNKAVAETLITNGADMEVKDNKGYTPLLRAAKYRTKEVVEALLEAGALVDAKEKEEGQTPLHFAARRGNLEIAEALIAAGAEVNALDRSGDTPLDRSEGAQTAELLRRHGGTTGDALREK